MKGAFGKSKFDKEIDQIRKNEVAVAASAQKEILAIQNKLNEDIQAIKDKYQPSIDALTTNISNFTSQAEATTGEIDAKVSELEGKIASSYAVIDSLNEEKFTLKGDIKAIEVEVGPIKYIAEFIYGNDPTTNILEDAVRWVIIIIIFVFDPLAVLLLIAANYSITRRFGKSIEDFAEQKFDKSTDNTGVEPDQYWKERYQDMQDQLDRFNKYKEADELDEQQEQARADKISKNVPPEIDDKSTETDTTENIDPDVRTFKSGNSHIRNLEKQIDSFKQREIPRAKSIRRILRKAREEDNEEELQTDLKDVEEKIKEDQPILEDENTEDDSEDSKKKT